MKQFLLMLFAAVYFIACQQPPAPKEEAISFLQHLHAREWDKAAMFATAQTTGNVKAPAQPAVPALPLDDVFHVSELKEIITDNSAFVENGIIKINMKKEEGGWRINADSALMGALEGRLLDANKLAASWDKLYKAYNQRGQVAKQYILYKKSLGATSPDIKVAEAELDSLKTQPVWSRATIDLFLNRQQKLQSIIDKMMEPSQSANADLTINYMVQMSHANDLISEAETDYQSHVSKTPSHTFLPIPAALTHTKK